MIRRCLHGLLLSAALGGCTSMSGLDAQTDFSCKAPRGVSCASITAIHANANAGTLPALRPAPEKGGAEGTGSGTEREAAERGKVSHATPAPLPTASAAAPGATPPVSAASMDAPFSGTPLRSPERILRVWLAPFEDADGDFHDQRYMYVTVSRGQWNVQRARAAVRNQYQIVRPLSREKEPAEQAAPKSPGPVAPASPTGTQ